MGRSILVTGGSGYFGETLAAGAVANGDRVRVFDVNPPAATAASFEFVQGDVRDREAVRGACDGVDVVLHNVAQVGRHASRSNAWTVASRKKTTRGAGLPGPTRQLDKSGSWETPLITATSGTSGGSCGLRVW